jgi:hypothetical protein
MGSSEASAQLLPELGNFYEATWCSLTHKSDIQYPKSKATRIAFLTNRSRFLDLSEKV